MSQFIACVIEGSVEAYGNQITIKEMKHNIETSIKVHKSKTGIYIILEVAIYKN